ncbi:MAG: hypothetical protein IPH64_17860 [Comamonadaceae bacterium]|nr:hypothetical protein [Comamonadaceae bacterium]
MATPTATRRTGREILRSGPETRWWSGTTARWPRSCATSPIVNPDDVPKHWPDERFDLIWVLVREAGE